MIITTPWKVDSNLTDKSDYSYHSTITSHSACSRPYKKVTLEQLESLGIKYHEIIFDLLHCERILVNDYSKTNSYPTAKSCNLSRNSKQLEDLLK